MGGRRRVRTLDLVYRDRQLRADFIDNAIVSLRPERIEKRFLPRGPGSLEVSLRAFLRAIRGRGTAVPDAPVAARVVDVAGRARCRCAGAATLPSP